MGSVLFFLFSPFFPQVGQELAARGHEFIVINTDYDGKQFGKDGKVNTDGITELLYPHPLTEAEMIGWLDEIAVLDPFTGRFNKTLINVFFFWWLVGGCIYL